MDIPDELRDIAERVADGQRPSTTPRKLIGWFGAQRRGQNVVARVRAALKALGLRTQPDFQWEYIDARVRFVGPESDPPPKLVVQVDADELVEDEESLPDEPERAYRLKMLAAANRPPLWVKPDDPLDTAVTHMLSHDYSQLPVMTTERDLKGAITWQSIATRLLFEKTCDHVRECMDPTPDVVGREESLFRVIPRISRHGYVLVRESDRRIGGIVTTADLTEEFGALAEPFLLLGEIEHYIRRLIAPHFDVDLLEEIRDPNDGARNVRGVTDLTFGEYVRLLQAPDHWARLGLPLDRVTFVAQLDAVREIRNDAVHFDPDGLGDDALTTLRRFSQLLQRITHLRSS